MSHLVAVADQRLADHHLADYWHLRFLPRIWRSWPSGPGGLLSLFAAFGGAEPVGQIATGR
jgi:hypothetical protein